MLLLQPVLYSQDSIHLGRTLGAGADGAGLLTDELVDTATVVAGATHFVQIVEVMVL